MNSFKHPDDTSSSILDQACSAKIKYGHGSRLFSSKSGVMKENYASTATGNKTISNKWNWLISPTQKAIERIMPDQFGGQKDEQPWTRSITKVLGVAASKKARIIGITGHRRGAGVSLIAQALAKACIGFGKSTVLIDASSFAQKTNSSNITKLKKEEYTVANLSEMTVMAPAGSQQYRQSLEETANTYDMIIIDLPPVGQSEGQMNKTFNSIGTACDIVFLVCLSGVVTKPELKGCLQHCKIIDVNLAGLILNDWKIPGSHLLTDT